VLTPRERQVVLLLSRGMTSKEAARELAISPRTVEDFRARLLKKFKVRNTAELLAHLIGVET
ncbi:MAG: LuxR C-terminal-related transcriptional regulator, partial [Paracoccaceae bacterium]